MIISLVNVFFPLILFSAVNGFIGGRNATLKEISRIVSLRNVVRDNQLFGTGHHCGGAVLTKSFILTCASCLADTVGNKFMLPGFIRVVGGTLNKDLMEEATFDSNLESIRPHPGYNFRSMAFNIAVVKMTKEIVYKKYNLKNTTLSDSMPKLGTECVITGWGKIGETKEPAYAYPQTGTVKLLDMQQCEKVYKEIPDHTLCFGAPGVSVCMEDVGTVVFCDKKAVGVIALVDLCRKTQTVIPFVATKIPKFYSWIKANKSGRTEIGKISLLLSTLVVITRYPIY